MSARAETRDGTPLELVASPCSSTESEGRLDALQSSASAVTILAELGFDQDRVLELEISAALA